MLFRTVLFLSFVAFASSRTCKYDKSDIDAQWIYANGSIQLHFQNTKLKNNEWTAIAFGDDKNNMDAIVFLVTNNQVAVRTGRAREEGVPAFSNGNSNITTLYSQYFAPEKTLNVALTVPLSFNGRSLQQCQKWNFFKKGKISNGNVEANDKKPSNKKVCPLECV